MKLIQDNIYSIMYNYTDVYRDKDAQIVSEAIWIMWFEHILFVLFIFKFNILIDYTFY